MRASAQSPQLVVRTATVADARRSQLSAAWNSLLCTTKSSAPRSRPALRELHARLPPGSSYVLLVAEANTDAREFYERHGLIVERRLDGPSHYSSAMGSTSTPPHVADALLMRLMKNSQTLSQPTVLPP